jgi:ribosome biogenesis GTPase / thiamine phosphate phosphatase
MTPQNGMTPQNPAISARAGDPPTDSLLPRLGFDDGWRAAFESSPTIDIDRPPTPARVTRTDRGACDVLGAAGPARATWGADVVAAVADDPQAVPSTGDWVRVQAWPDGNHTVEAVLARRTAVVRAQVNGSSAGQVLAANVDVVAVVEGLYPDPDLGRIERFLALAWDSGATPRVVLTKGDLSPDPAGIAADIAQQVAAGCPVDVVVAHRSDGLAGLERLLTEGATLALLGASGVGKSTLVNALLGGEVMRTQGLGAVHKGRHTTVTRELHLRPGGGLLIDTPGLRSVGLQGGAGLAEVFADVDALAAECRFTDCGHQTEPGCAVLDAVGSGELAERRLASWRKLAREAAYQERRVDARLRAAELAVWKQRTKGLRPPRAPRSRGRR